ncbi:MAG: recombination protein RecR [Deltaproteobacteria bacterium]|nr:recombination protein RecR [Deltaproteobacteria bacterium]
MNSLRCVATLVKELSRLPGIGEKTAQRLAFYILKLSRVDAEALARSILEVKEKVRICSRCFNITEEDPCHICRDSGRTESQICVVEEPHDLLAIEKAGVFKGKYHVLQGSLSPLDGRGPDDIRVRELLARLKGNGVDEVIIATNPNNDGETTAHYLVKVIKPLGVKITKIAQGIPMGGDLEYTDNVTVVRAVEGRREVF